jgi:hypothetical protein
MATTASGTTRTAPTRRSRAMRLPRTTGAFSGMLIVLLGLWGALIPFIGPYFHYAFGGYQTWHYTSQRLWLCIVPGAVAVIGGLMLLRASTRVGGLTAGWVALAAGVWFAVGPSVSLLWHHTIYAIGTPAGGDARQVIEWVGYFYGLGAAIIGLSAFAMGRFVSRPRIVEEPVVAAEAAVADRETVHEERAAAPPVAERDHAYEEGDAVREPAYEERGAAPVTDREAAHEEPAGESANDSDAPAATTTYEQPTRTGDAAATTSYEQPAGTTYRRRPGLLRRLRGQ